MSLLRKSILLQVVIALILGSLLGGILPENISRIFATFNGLFGNFLEFSIPLIILGLIVSAIGKLGKGAGKLLLITAAIAYGSTIFAGFLSYGVSMGIFPQMLSPGSLSNVSDSAKELQPYFEIEMPPLFDVMSGLILSFILGIYISKNDFPTMENFFNEFQKLIMQLIEKVIVPFLPLFIFGIFLEMTYSGQVVTVLSTFIKIIGIIFAMHVGLLLLQYFIAGSIVKRNPFKLLKTMLPAYFTALGTQSSAATIPVTLKQAKENKVNPKIAGFSIPLCATIHLSGSILKIVACAVALMLIQGMPIDFLQMAGFIFMLGIAMIAAPGVPGGAIMAALAVLSSALGFDSEQQSLMIALYITMDSFGTAANITGDGAIALVLDKIYRNKAIA